jgi:DNA-binding NarL/FixJ family response regulator
MKYKIIVVDDHKLFNEGIKRILATDFEVVAQIYDGKEAVHAIHKYNPDLVLLDINLPNRKGLEIGQEIKKDFQNTKVVFLSMYSEAGFIQAAKAMNADGYILKDSESTDLIEAVTKILQGEIFYDPKLDTQKYNLHHDDYFAKTYSLSKREVEIISFVKNGFSSEEIAQKLFLSFETVRSHRKNIYLKLGINKLSDLIQFANEHNL